MHRLNRVFGIVKKTLLIIIVSVLVSCKENRDGSSSAAKATLVAPASISLKKLNSYPVTAPLVLDHGLIALGTTGGLSILSERGQTIYDHGFSTFSMFQPSLTTTGDILLSSDLLGLIIIKKDYTSVESVLVPSSPEVHVSGTPLVIDDHIAVPIAYAGGILLYDNNYQIIHPSAEELSHVANIQSKLNVDYDYEKMQTMITPIWDGFVEVNVDNSVAFYKKDYIIQWKTKIGYWSYYKAINTIDNNILVAEKGGELAIINKSGEIIMSNSAGSAILAQPVDFGDGLVCICTKKELMIYNTLSNTITELNIKTEHRIVPCVLKKNKYAYIANNNIIIFSSEGKVEKKLTLPNMQNINYGLYSLDENNLFFASGTTLGVVSIE